MGSSAAFVPAPISGVDCKRVAVSNAFSQAWRLGRTVLEAKHAQTDPVAAAVEAENGRVLFVGKIIDVTRTAADNVVYGDVQIAEVPATNSSLRGSRLRDEPQSVCRVRFQNEFLACELLSDDPAASRGATVLALVPDLISVLESDTGRAIGSEELKYGQRCSVVSIPCSPLLKTPAALKVVGPQAFGLAQVYEAGQLGEYKIPRAAFGADASQMVTNGSGSSTGHSKL